MEVFKHKSDDMDSARRGLVRKLETKLGGLDLETDLPGILKNGIQALRIPCAA